MKIISVAIALSLSLLARAAVAQTAGAVTTTADTGALEQLSAWLTPMPQGPVLIPLAGSVRSSSGEPRAGQVAVRLALYASESDRAPLATEEQLITLGADGTYQVLFGATSSSGLPASLFTQSAPRWVGVTIDQDRELPRTAIVFVPYAARAASADALGNRTAADFVLSDNLQQTLQRLGFSPTKTPGAPGTASISAADPTTPNATAKYADNIEVTGATTTGTLRVGGAGGIPVTRDATYLVVNGNLRATGTLEAKYQDVAEWVDAAEPLAAGTVVAAHPTLSNHVRRSTRAYDTTVLGVVSYQPGLLLGEQSGDKVAVAQSGRVRARVDARYGAIKPGDLLVASPIAGVAMRSRPTRSGLHRPGTIIGKALEAWPAGAGEILVLLTLQ